MTRFSGEACEARRFHPRLVSLAHKSQNETTPWPRFFHATTKSGRPEGKLVLLSHCEMIFLLT